MKLIYTPRSHFTRKVRILLAALGIEVELVDIVNAGSDDPAVFGPNPLMKVPVLVDGECAVYESDHIAAYLVRRHDPDDRFGVLATDPDQLNARAVMNGVMALEVELVLAGRSGMDTAQPRFDKMRAGIAQGLAWLDARHDLFPDAPSYLGFHLVSMWEHLALYGLMDRDHPRLRERVAAYVQWPYVAASRPV